MGILNPILPDPARETKTPWAPFPPGIMDFNNPPRRSYIGRSPAPAPTIDCPDWKEWPFLTRKEDAQAFTQDRKKNVINFYENLPRAPVRSAFSNI